MKKGSQREEGRLPRVLGLGADEERPKFLIQRAAALETVPPNAPCVLLNEPQGTGGLGYTSA